MSASSQNKRPEDKSIQGECTQGKKLQRVQIKHQTQYRFDRPTTIMPHVIRLRPAPHCRVPIESYDLKIKPENHTFNWQQDPFSNFLSRLFFPEKTQELSFTVTIIAEITDINPFDFFLEESALNVPFEYDPILKEHLAPYLKIEESGPLLSSLVESVDLSPQPTIDFLVSINKQVHQLMDYNLRLEEGVLSCEQALQKGIGSCRDNAWLLIQLLRHLGLASRFVSGYEVQLNNHEEKGEEKGEEDRTDLHAWAEVYISGAGWVGLDPTSGLFAAGSHIPLACTPDPLSAAPITGNTGKAKVEFSYSNTVTRLP